MFVKISQYFETLKFFKIFNPYSLPLYWNKKSLKTLDYEAVVESMINVENTRSRGSYTRFTYVDRFQIWRYAGENGNKKALIHFKYKFPGLKKSTVRTFKKQHQKELKKVWSQERWPSKVIKAKKKRNTVTSWWAWQNNSNFIKKQQEQELNHVQCRTCTWARSLLHGMGLSDLLGRQEELKFLQEQKRRRN